MATMLIVRHCESTGQQPDAALTAAGDAAAIALIEPLATLDPDAIYSSPYRRALDTVRPFAMRADLPVREDRRLRERELAAQPTDDWMAHLRRSYDDHDHKLPGGESLNDAQVRALAALADIAAAGHRLPVLVSHGGLISAVLRAADPAFGYDAWRSLRNPDLFEVTHDAGRPIAFVRIE